MASSSSRSSKPPRILSHYRLLQVLGSGAMGSVYAGVDRREDYYTTSSGDCLIYFEE